VLFPAHYAGWPRAARLNMEVEKIIARIPAATGDPGDDLP